LAVLRPSSSDIFHIILHSALSLSGAAAPENMTNILGQSERGAHASIGESDGGLVANFAQPSG
jgi:hypothetical protein